MPTPTKIKPNVKVVKPPVPVEPPVNVQVITLEQAVLRSLSSVQASIEQVKRDVAEIKAALYAEN